MKFKNYVKVQSLEEAYTLNQKKSSRVLGGMLWMRLGHGQFGTAIDLSGLGLDKIEETAEEFRIGCMVTLRQLELHEGLQAYTKDAIRESVRHIVGVQFRNLATVGGSIFGRFGFSDVLTMFLALDTEVELYPSGRMSLEEFSQEKRTNDILARLIVKKHRQSCVYLSQRNTKTDFPVLTCAVSVDEQGARAVIGATPARARVYPLPEEAVQMLESAGNLGAAEHRPEKQLEDAGCLDTAEREKVWKTAAAKLAVQIPTSSNMRGSAAYRTHLVKVLVQRALEALWQQKQQRVCGGMAEAECCDGVCQQDEKSQTRDERSVQISANMTAEGASVPQSELSITLTLNGKRTVAVVPADQTLYDFLRERNCYSVKCGCDTSNCGLCTVLLDGKPVLSCSLLAVRTDGHCVDTMEGLQKEAEEFGRFVALQGAEQCGFCNPGMIMNAIALFRELQDPTDEEIQEYLAGNLCRCSGYEGQTRAIREFQRYRAGITN